MERHSIQPLEFVARKYKNKDRALKADQYFYLEYFPRRVFRSENSRCESNACAFSETIVQLQDRGRIFLDGCLLNWISDIICLQFPGDCRDDRDGKKQSELSAFVSLLLSSILISCLFRMPLKVISKENHRIFSSFTLLN